MNNIYKHRMKIILRDRSNLFWTLLFPLLLVTFFSLSFGSALENSEVFQVIPVAFVEQEDANLSFTQTLDALNDEGTVKLSIQLRAVMLLMVL